MLATRYLQVWSSNGALAVASVPRIYRQRVTFYGRSYSHQQLVAEKRQAIRRWPLRRYAHRPGTMRISCDVPQKRCMASSIIDYAVESPARGAANRGAARFALGIDFAGPSPRIFHEGGSVTRRRS
jgi:hypothetical protein